MKIEMLRIVCLGNVLRGDDGIGPEVLKELHKIDFPIKVDLCDIGSDVFMLLDHLISSDTLIIIDCAQMGRAPGEVRKFNIDGGNMPVLEKLVSLHGFGFREIYKMAQSLGEIASCVIIGIEPKNITFNASLSNDVKKSIPLVIQLVSEEIKKYD
jgi:hydrogenase maturation protease